MGGDDDIRLIGSPVVHTSIVVLRSMHEETLSDNPVLYEEGWEPDHYAREDLVMKEYRHARIGTCASLIFAMNSGQKQTSDYCMCYNMLKEGRTIYVMDIDEPKLPSLRTLLNTKSPPPNYVEMGEYYYRYYVNQARAFNWYFFRMHYRCIVSY